ncbi:MAG: translesion error-prone DNA polymerase V autoproteolytic subunit [Pseudomonadota bacterium]|nr:translesion error-prone DNA polymerase V autoproteolytic subunit [Pseudomonadota bacterium]
MLAPKPMLTIAGRTAEFAPRILLPLVGGRVPAGFPSPADDYIEGRIDLNEHLIRNKEATFIFRVKGWSMLKAGIHDGDELIVDRSVEPCHRHIVVAVVNGQLTVKRLHKRARVVRLLSENDDHPCIEFKDGDELQIWGVVTTVLHKV